MPYRDPERQREYQREYGRLRRIGDAQTPRQTAIPTPFRLKTAADVLALLEEQFGAVRSDETLTTVERARTVGYLAGISLKAIEAGEEPGMAKRAEVETFRSRRLRCHGEM
jgi:hypothetical protein